MSRVTLTYLRPSMFDVRNGQGVFGRHMHTLGVTALATES